MPRVEKFNNEVAPWLRLLTPVLMAIVLYYITGLDKKFEIMTNMVLSIKSEQDTRTIKVQESYRHIFDDDKHKHK